MDDRRDDVGKRGESSKPMEKDIPDLDEDELDDLDDMLDEFSATKIDTKSDAPAPSGPGRPADAPTSALVEEPDTAHDFDKQLQEQMAALVGEIDESPEVRQQMEYMMKEISAAADAVPQSGNTHSGPDTTSPPASSSGAEESFQETIRKTMERMQTSGAQATAAATSDDSDDILAQMLKDMQGGGLGGAGGDEDFSRMLMGMMEQLTNKDILYEPMKELHDKFPGWMTKNGKSTKADDLQRFQEQQRLVEEIVGKFEEKEYSDTNAADREYIVERMQEARPPLLLPVALASLIPSK